MFENVLTHEQMVLAERLFPEVNDFYLAGGTALALQIGHRRSVDFDLASSKEIVSFDIERRLISRGFDIQTVFTATSDEFSVLIDRTRVTYFSFPFKIQPKITWKRAQIRLPEIIDLGAMKAYALGRRSMWKDYVDLYFLLKFKLSLAELIEKSRAIFSSHFNAKLFREQLCYFEDIDFSETIEYIDYSPDDNEIQEFLEAIAVKI
jgi:hypothetical protein